MGVENRLRTKLLSVATFAAGGAETAFTSKEDDLFRMLVTICA
jgi:hypothetical protein